MHASLGCFANIYRRKKNVLFLFLFYCLFVCVWYLLRIWDSRQGAAMLVRSLLTKNRKVPRDVCDNFATTIRPCLWRHWYGLLGAKWQLLTIVFSRLSNTDIILLFWCCYKRETGKESEWKTAVCLIFITFLWRGPVMFLRFVFPPFNVELAKMTMTRTDVVKPDPSFCVRQLLWLQEEQSRSCLPTLHTYSA